MPEIEHDEYLQVWTFSAKSALDLFGLKAEEHDVVVLKDKPTTEREIAAYKPEVKLFGIKRTVKPDLTTTREALLKQEIDRFESKIEHHRGRVNRGTADAEDLIALAVYIKLSAFVTNAMLRGEE